MDNRLSSTGEKKAYDEHFSDLLTLIEFERETALKNTFSLSEAPLGSTTLAVTKLCFVLTINS